MKGYIYAVCRTGDASAVKIGFTTSFAVEQYLHDSYSRTLSPLQILLVIPVSNARLSEGVIHHVLQPYRIMNEHELFNLSLGLEPLYNAWHTVCALDEQAFLPLPPDRPFCMNRWKLFRGAAKAGSRMQTRLAKKNFRAWLKQEELREAEKRQNMQRQEEERQRMLAECWELLRTKKAELQSKAAAQVLSSFLNAAIEQGGKRDYVKRSDVYMQFL